jgi:hypothetical protein
MPREIVTTKNEEERGKITNESRAAAAPKQHNIIYHNSMNEI